MLVHEIPVDRVPGDDLARDVIEDRQIAVGFEDDFQIRAVGAHVAKGRQVDHAYVGIAHAPVHDPRPQHRMHLGHVRAPQDHRLRVLDVVVVTRRLVGAEGAVEGGHRAGHAVAGIRIHHIGPEACLEQLVHRIAFLDRPLPGSETGDPLGTLLRIGPAELALHLVEGLFPRYRDEVALLVELAVPHPHQRLG